MNKPVSFPLVSILIPCYNHERYVVQALKSVMENTYPNKEIVVIDDGSKDFSYDRIVAWGHDNQKKIVLRSFKRQNKGLANTLNELIDLSQGEYLCFLASDDMLTSDSIEKRMQKLLNSPDKLAVIGDAKVIDSEGKILMESAIEDLYRGKKSNYKTLEGLKYSVIREWSIPGPVIIAKKSLFDIIGKYPTNLLAEDLNFYLQVIGRELLVFIDETVALYRVHDLNTCRIPQYSRKINASIIKSLYNNLRYYRGRNKYFMYINILRTIKSYLIVSVKGHKFYKKFFYS